jgi:hypothetical protein
MFWGNAEIDAADVFDFCLWCHHKHDLEHIILDFANVPAYELVLGSFYIYAHYRSLRPGSEGWFAQRTLSAKVAKIAKVGLWITVLEQVTHLKATDSRDYIYSFLGCPAAISNTKRPYLQADYTISRDELYRHLAETLLRNPAECSWVLCAVKCQEREDLMQSLTPSWIPSWNTKILVQRIASVEHWYRAGGHHHLFQSDKHDGNTLAIRGILFDKVAWMSNVLVSQNFRVSQSQHTQAAESDAEPYIDSLWDQVSKYLASVDMKLQRKDFLLTLMAGYRAGASSQEPWHLQDLNEYLKMARSKLSPGPLQEQDERGKYDAAYAEAELDSVHNHRIVVTLHGRIGLVPAPSTRLADTLCIFHGVSVPFILAPTIKGRFKLAGQAYIHGVMNGELVDDFEAKDILLE